MYRESDRLIIKGKVWNLFQNRIVVTDYDNSFCLYDLAAKGHRSWETSIEIQAIFNIGFIKDTSLYINDGSSSSYVLNVLNGQIEKKLNLSVNDSLGDLGLIGIMRDGKYCVGCVQLNEPEKIIWSVSPNPFFEVFDSNYLLGFPKPGEYGKNSSIFGRYSADTGALLWHFDVTEPGRYREWYPEGPEHPGVVTKFLGVWQGRPPARSKCSCRSPPTAPWRA
jgi:outer membrane protein assembly factor BamB